MLEKNNFDKPLKLMKICMLLSGIKVYRKQWHPLTEAFVKSVYYINILILYSVIFGEVYWLVDGIQIGRDFVEMSLPAPCVTISILSTLKTVPLYFKSDIVRHIMETLKQIHPINAPDENTDRKAKNKINRNKNTGRKQKKNTARWVKEDTGCIECKEEIVTVNDIITKAEKVLNTVGSLLAIISLSVLIMFLFSPLISMYLKYFKTDELRVKYPFSVKYWFEIYEVSFWPLVYTQQCLATAIVCFNIFGTENLFYFFCTYIEMHFQILCNQLEGIQPGTSTQEELAKAVKKHQLLIHLVDQTEALFSLPVLFHIVCSSFLICLSAFNITVAKEIGSVFAFFTFLCLSFSQVSLLCFFGDKLMRSSTEVSGAVYKSPWYHFDVRDKKVVLIILMRAQKPCKLTACNFAELNLRAFTTILSRSWSYFALLKTVYK